MIPSQKICFTNTDIMRIPDRKDPQRPTHGLNPAPSPATLRERLGRWMEARLVQGMPSDSFDPGRRRVLQLLGAAVVGATVGLPTTAWAQEHEQSGSGHDAEQEGHHGSPSLAALDFIGTLSFVDAVQALALEKPSYVTQTSSVFGFLKSTTPETPSSQSPEDEGHGDQQEHAEHGHHETEFPLANMALAIVLNLIRMTAFDHETSHHTSEELKTTVVGVALLMGLTSLAKGIVEAEREAERMTHADAESIQNRPREVIGESIFQLTFLAAATQLPLTAFGNAAIGKGEFDEVGRAFEVCYQRWGGGWEEGFSRSQLEQEWQSGAIKAFNPVIAKRIGKLLQQDDLKGDDSQLLEALKTEAKDHTHDVMIVLMSTACDDAQAALGDAGPLVGLFQAYGLEFMKAIVPTLPYTLLVSLDRSLLAAQRAGVSPDMVINQDRFDYLQQFLTTTWKNFAAYFVHVGPELTSKITGSPRAGRREVTGGPGRDFDVVQQMFRDLESFFNAFRDCFRSDESFDQHSVRRALAKMAAARSEYHERLGQEVSQVMSIAREQGSETVELPLDLDARAQHDAFGQPVDDPLLLGMQTKVREMALNPETENAVNELAAEFARIRDESGPQILEALHKLTQEQQGQPSMKAVAGLMRENPHLKEIVDFNYWHDRIGAELTDTMFVVFLQGLHLSFIISTVENYVYRTEKFRSLSLHSQEIISVLLNDVLSMFADNWADCVAHSKWLTIMYFNELDKVLDELHQLSEGNEKMTGIMQAFTFTDNPTQPIPERYRVRREQFCALVHALWEANPDAEDELTPLLTKFYDQGEAFYYKSMIMSLITAVTGGGKALTGNAPHFTFKNGHDDYKLSTTLADFQKHPLYAVWEFLFSTTYSISLGPNIARAMFSQDHGQDIQKMMQGRFRDAFPDFEATLERLREAEGK